ncbi:MAG: deoxyribodipyrimidine photo-lyase [Devosia sp.]|nr:deoxyribodipyrimidine photo-lyase [Devosia sp.]
MSSRALVWFRNDLRIADHPALNAALSGGTDVLALFIHEEGGAQRTRGAAARWWLHHSLNALAGDLAGLGVPLHIVEGPADRVVPDLIAEHGISDVYWNRRYGPAEREADGLLKASLRGRGIAVRSFAGSVLAEPFDMATGAGKPFSVFTPFWRALRTRQIPPPLPRPAGRPARPRLDADTGYVAPQWTAKLHSSWRIGEAAAQEQLIAFLEAAVGDYARTRDVPGLVGTSRLSPHLAFGEISPRQVWHAAQSRAHGSPQCADGIDKFLSELAWRDFNYHQFYHRPDIATAAMVARYKDVPWRSDDAAFAAWTQGRTGFPIVDAGMRELWQTGTMHNRVRMLAASLLAKNLLIDWRRGEGWFWDTLVDADAASNPGNWQWVAGSGLDASPYFRIFNPVTQGERFDPQGIYVRRWVPELAAVPDAWIHHPFEAPAEVLAAAQVHIGSTYPAPIVDLKRSRQRALDALSQL